jgi:hypothetical protein
MSTFNHPALTSLFNMMEPISKLPAERQPKAYDNLEETLHKAKDGLMQRTLGEQVDRIKPEDVKRLHELEIQTTYLSLADPSNPTARAKLAKAFEGKNATGDLLVSSQIRNLQESATNKTGRETAERFIVSVVHNNPHSKP